jgi:hypothetical protein
MDERCRRKKANGDYADHSWHCSWQRLIEGEPQALRLFALRLLAALLNVVTSLVDRVNTILTPATRSS